MVARRCAGVPLEHVLGWVEFCGLRVAVDEGVFVPRRRSEVLAELASTLVAPGGTLVDVCCGSGALGVAAVRLAARRGVTGVRLVASDLDPVAVRCAARNLAPLGGTALVGDLLQPLPEDLRAGIDVLVANVPYVPTEAIRLMPPEARDHEPRVTLDGGADGLDVLRRLAATAAGWLAPGGRLLTELGPEQVRPARDVLADASFTVEVAGEPDLPALVCSR
jgi:release factor glutamine methyltransferase